MNPCSRELFKPYIDATRRELLVNMYLRGGKLCRGILMPPPSG